MVEAIMSTVILKITCLITQKITDEIKFELGLSRELESIKNELQIITAFLRDAEDRGERSDSVKAWVRQVRDVAYRMEDVIDEHVMLVYTRRKNQADELYCLSFTLSILSCQATQYIKEWFPRRKIASSIADIKAEVLEIQQRKVLYNLEVTEKVGQNMNTDTDTGTSKSPRACAHMWQDPRVGFLYPRESDLVGIEDPKSEILKLLDLDMKDLRCLIISIVGMGGIGKTTLAWKVYDNIEMKRHFYVRAWVNVTQFYNRKDVFRRMLQEFYNSAMQPIPAQVHQMDEMSLVSELRTFLEDKRCEYIYFPHILILGDDNGSRIVLTTRQENVALNWKGSWTKNHIYKLQLLPHNKAWKLFCNKAFEGGQCPQWLEEVTHSIIAKCGGLPLALVTLGGLLSTKAKAFVEWKKFRDSLGSELEQNPQLSNISRILLLSYNGLPHFLKPCLIYFSIFPESSTIECNRLIKLWIAEDLIKEKRGITVEDVAKEYLLELIQRNLVQVSTWYDCGRARTIRVHDLLHDILRQKLEELNFGQILMAKEENREVNIQSRRLSIQEDSLQNEALKYINSTTTKCSIRPLFTFGVKEVATTLLRSTFLNRFYLLKVFDLQAAPVEELPTEIGELFLLQYLSLRSTKVKRIPKTIGKLINLLTLDLKKCPVCELPVEVGNLRRLRHLIVYQNTWHNTLKVWEIRAVRVPEGALGGLENLQKLADVNIATSDGFIDQLCAFKKLRYLAISNIKERIVGSCARPSKNSIALSH
ncbi:disease resistance protein RPM1-like [Chenopodium quinoa]|uniref:disease resistance protein RPM1-like n=1 Tax=Chenopodium quinoa TaxID=63459 RepID=UPI000B788B20|nr:disease resistance protein RPM1-like [Chenopodium quinoa]